MRAELIEQAPLDKESILNRSYNSCGHILSPTEHTILRYMVPVRLAAVNVPAGE
jgi:hypothetical protein